MALLFDCDGTPVMPRRRQGRDERLRRMSPEARATYDRIRTLREEIGPLDFDIIKALRVIRDDD